MEKRLLLGGGADETQAAKQFPRILQLLYGDGETGMVSEEGILAWAATKRATKGEAGALSLELFEMKGT